MSSDDPIAALNEVLNELIDVVQKVKQAQWKVPRTHPLHVVIEELFDDMRSWVGLLFDEDRILGVSPLTRMSSVAGRTPSNLWSGTASDEEVRRIIAGELDRFAQHVMTALAQQEDDDGRAALLEVERGLLAHRRALAELDIDASEPPA